MSLTYKTRVEADGTRYRDNGRLCNAKENTCGAFAVRGRTKCRNHGGASIRSGPGHPSWKHGRDSKLVKALPKALHRAYVDALENPELISDREEIALLDVRQIELAGKCFKASEDSGKLWAELRQIVVKVEKAREDGDIPEAERLLKTMFSLIEKGTDPDAQWRELRRTMLDRNKLIQTEIRREELGKAVITMEQFHAFVTATLALVASQVPDQKTGRRLADGIVRLVSAQIERGIPSSTPTMPVAPTEP